MNEQETARIGRETLPHVYPSPPRPLGADGSATVLKSSVSTELPTPAASRRWYQACAAIDRIAEYSEQIARDGVVVQTKSGLRDHPLLGTKSRLAPSFVERSRASVST